MSPRLQILLDEDEFEAIRAAARRRRTTVSEYVRDTLRQARAQEPSVGADRRPLVIREAAAHACPSGDIDEIEAEIRAGYTSASSPPPSAWSPT